MRIYLFYIEYLIILYFLLCDFYFCIEKIINWYWNNKKTCMETGMKVYPLPDKDGNETKILYTLSM